MNTKKPERFMLLTLGLPFLLVLISAEWYVLNHIFSSSALTTGISIMMLVVFFNSVIYKNWCRRRTGCKQNSVILRLFPLYLASYIILGFINLFASLYLNVQFFHNVADTLITTLALINIPIITAMMLYGVVTILDVIQRLIAPSQTSDSKASKDHHDDHSNHQLTVVDTHEKQKKVIFGQDGYSAH